MIIAVTDVKIIITACWDCSFHYIYIPMLLLAIVFNLARLVFSLIQKVIKQHYISVNAIRNNIEVYRYTCIYSENLLKHVCAFVKIT